MPDHRSCPSAAPVPEPSEAQLVHAFCEAVLERDRHHREDNRLRQERIRRLQARHLARAEARPDR
jgi:hypothetical protein